MTTDELTPRQRNTKARLPVILAFRRRLQGRHRRYHETDTHHGLEQRTTAKSGALRAAIFGANDGLVSNVSLIMGFAGAGVERGTLLLAGVAGLLAGAFSMGAGEYVSMRVQREVFERLIELETRELEIDPVTEQRELAEIYEGKGISRELAERLSAEVMRDPAVAVDTHAREELGLDPDDLGSPWGAAGSSFVTFAAGAFVPLLPFLFGGGATAIFWSAILAGVTLFSVGAAMSVITARSAWWSGVRMLGIGTAAAAVTFGVGSLLGVSIGG